MNQIQRNQEEEDLYMTHQKREAKRQTDEAIASAKKKKRKKNDMSNSAKLYVIGHNSGMPSRRGTSDDSPWWIDYILFPELMTQQMLHKFRDHFRMSFRQWQDLVKLMKSSVLFSSWFDGNTNGCGVEASPIELLCLGALRYIGRKCTFDCM